MMDALPENKEEFVTSLNKSMKPYRSAQPFQDTRKQTFKGLITLENGDKYQGTWVTMDDETEVPHGRGLYVYSNGSQYAGYLQEGKIVGGRIIYHNGDVYEGEFEDQKYNGKGKYILAESHMVTGYYEGTFECNKITGEGNVKIISHKPLTQIFGSVAID